MKKAMIHHVITTECPLEDEARFQQWYNEVHIPMLLKFKPLMGAARYKLAGEPHRYIAVYRFASWADFEAFGKSPELAAALEELQGTWGDSIKIASMAQWEFIKDWEK
jgi:antibiotic biosynthesis monooxygenase (ABM) superfamily enzyme